jgi:dienelactone hydrolase
VDSFTERGIGSTVGAQGQLSELAVIIDAYRALELLAKHARIDPTRIGLLGSSRGGVSALYASMKRFQRMYAPVDAQFAVYLSLYPPCSRTYIDDTDVVDRPIRLLNGTADEIAPIRQCLSYVKRLQDAGKDAQLTEYAGAFHGFDGPGTTLTRVRLGDSDAPRRGCDLYEQPAGRIVNRETGLPFTRNDDCLKGVGTLLYDARAHAKAIEDVSALLQRVFRLAQQ